MSARGITEIFGYDFSTSKAYLLLGLVKNEVFLPMVETRS